MPNLFKFDFFFSIIIPCFNHGHFLETSVNSVLNQNFKNFEILIINDGSTDSSQSIAEILLEKDSRIRLVNKINGGLSSARNEGLKIALGQVILFLDADDKLLPNALPNIHAYFKDDPNIDLIICSYIYFKQLGDFHTHIFKNEFLGLESFFKSNIAPPVSFFIKKSCQEQVGLFDESLKSCEDWDFWIRAAKSGAKFKTISDILVGYRYVPTSMSRNALQMYQALKEVSFRAVRVDPRISSALPFNKDYNFDVEENLKFHLLRCLGVYLMQGNVSESIIWFKEEKRKWNWEIQLKDFEAMNSNLSFRYFLEKLEIENLLKDTLSDFEFFFSGIGFNIKDQKKVVQIIFAPQLKKRNHFRYGKWIGAVINRLTF